MSKANLRKHILKRDKHKCRYCGRQVYDDEGHRGRDNAACLTKINQVREHKPSNLVIACRRCNLILANHRDILGELTYMQQRAYIRRFCGLTEDVRGIREPYGQEYKHKILARDGYRCQYCGVKVDPNRPYEDDGASIDHIIPIARGGTNIRDNLITACRNCNEILGREALHLTTLQAKQKYIRKVKWYEIKDRQQGYIL